MVELNDMSVAELVRRQIVIFDVIGGEAASKRRFGFIALSRQPLAVSLHFVARINRRHRRWNPAGFKSVGGICPSTNLSKTEFLSGFDDCRSNNFAIAPRPEQFEAGLSRHSVTQRADLPACDGKQASIEKTD